MTTESDQFVVEAVEPIWLPLVNRFYRQCRYSAKAGRGEHVYVVRQNNNIVAAVRLQPKHSWLFLRSMCVAPERRGQGVGTLLLKGLASMLSEHDCYCYPFEHLQHFYAQAGFNLAPVDDEGVLDAPEFMLEAFERYRNQGRKLILMQRPASQ